MARRKLSAAVEAALAPLKGDERVTFVLRVAYRPVDNEVADNGGRLTENEVWRLVGPMFGRLANEGLFLESVAEERRKK